MVQIPIPVVLPNALLVSLTSSVFLKRYKNKSHITNLQFKYTLSKIHKKDTPF